MAKIRSLKTVRQDMAGQEGGDHSDFDLSSAKKSRTVWRDNNGILLRVSASDIEEYLVPLSG